MKKDYKIGEVAKILNISKNKIRFYEEEGLINIKREDGSNYRYFNNEDILQIQTILLYRFLDIPLRNIRDIMKSKTKSNLVSHLEKQLQIINDDIQYRFLVKQCLENIIDISYENKDIYKESIFDKVKEEINKIENTHKIKNNWKDLWNFNNIASGYDKLVKSSPGEIGIYDKYEVVLKNIFEKAIEDKEKEDIKVLDIGVGTGNLSSYFIEEKIEIIGIDQSREMLSKAREKFPNLKLRFGEFLKIPFNDNSFDIIVSTYAFHHLNNKEKIVALEEMKRVLKDNGRIVIGDLMFEDEQEKLNILSEFSDSQIKEIEDEYYSNIDFLENNLLKIDMELEYKKISKLAYIISIEKRS